MKKLFTLTLAILLSFSLFGRPRPNPAVIDKHVTDWVLDQLRDMGYTILPEVIVQDTLNRHKQKFSSRYETKGGRGMMMPDWANDSTWYPGQKEPKKEFDDLYYQPSVDGKKIKHVRRDYIKETVDTLVKENPNIEVNYIYNDDPFYYSNMIGGFYHGGFNYWHYNPFFYDPWDFDFGWGWNPYYGYNYPYGFGYPYYNYGFGFGYNSYWGFGFGWNHWNYGWHGNNWNHNNWYSHNGSWNNGGNYRRPEYGRRESPSNLTQTNSTINRRMPNTQQGGNRMMGQQRMQPQDKPMYNQQNRRTYTPSYDNPRMTTRPQYNNSRMGNMNNMGNRGSNMQNSGMNNMQNRRTQISTQSSTQSRTYSPPTRSYNSTPSRSYNNSSSGSFNQGSSRSYNSGSSNFSGSRSSGSSSSSAGSSSGGRSSGGSSTGRR